MSVRDRKNREEAPPRNGEGAAPNGAPPARQPLSDEDRERLIEEARADLPKLDRQVEENLDRLRELSRS
jgi:hypothetical protein